MTQESFSGDFEGSIDFSGRPSLSRTSSNFDLYGYGFVPNKFYSPTLTNYSTEDYIDSDYGFSDHDLDIQGLGRSGMLVLPQNFQRDIRSGQIPAHVDRPRPPSSYPYDGDMAFPISQPMAEISPASSSLTHSSTISKNTEGHRQNQDLSPKTNTAPAAKKNEKNTTLDAVSSSQRKRKPANRPKPEKPKVPKLDGPLSEITKDYVDVPVRDMDRWVHRSIEERRREVEKRGGHVARPMNSFMLYRSAFAERTKIWCLQNNHQIVSLVSGASWPLEPAYIREKYNELARIERINHQAAHPGYKFSPTKGQIPFNRRRKPVSDAENDSNIYSSDIDEPEDHAPKRPSPPIPKKKKQTPKKQEKEYCTPPPAILPRHAMIGKEETTEMVPEGRLQTGAEKSAYETLNPGRPRPMSMLTSEMDGSYYQTVVRPNAIASVGSSTIEDVTIRKAAAPTATYHLLIGENEDSKRYEDIVSLQNQYQQRNFLHENNIVVKQDPNLIEQNFFAHSHNNVPEIDMEHYQKLLNQQILQNIAAQQSYGLSQNELAAPYAFVMPGIGYSASCMENEENLIGMMGQSHTAGPGWPSVDENGNIIHGEVASNIKYDEWLTE